MAETTKTVRIHYRTATFYGPDDGLPPPVFEDVVRTALNGPLGQDFDARAFKLWENRADEAVINASDVTPPGVFVEIYHVDSRRELTFLKKQAKQKTATVLSRDVPEDENAMGAAAYMLILGNHIAAIEPIALKSTNLTNYFTAFLQKANTCGPSDFWKLVPKVQMKPGSALAKRGVTRLEIIPDARFVGEGPSETPQEAGKKRGRPTARAEERMARGGKVVELLEVLGASDADLDEVRASLSNDLGLEAKIEIRVRKNNRKTTAKLETDDIAQAIASLEENNRVAVVSPDGKQRNSLTTLSDTMEVLEVGGLLKASNVAAALSAALHQWAARGMIDLSGHAP